MKYDIFISYRREGGYDTAKHLYDLLIRDGYKVSFDIDTLRNGDFDIQLYDRISECQDFILIVDSHAFDRTLDKNFNPDNDWLRCELAHALKLNKNVVPIFLNGIKTFPDGLPADIKKVYTKHGPQYNQYYFDEFYNKLKSSFITSSPSTTPKWKNIFKIDWSIYKYILTVLCIVNCFLLIDEMSAYICPRQFTREIAGQIYYKAYALIDLDELFGGSIHSSDEALMELQERVGHKFIFTLCSIIVSVLGLIGSKKKQTIVYLLISLLLFCGFWY